MTENNGEKHSDILKQGVRIWNQWREDNPGILPELSEENLGGEDLSGADFRGANLAYANLIRASLWGTDFRLANLTGANLNGTDLSGANFGGANISRANLRGANLTEADLRGVNLRQAKIRDTKLRTAYLRGANLWGADLRGANLSETNLIKADLRGANLKGANLSYAYLISANLTGADISGAILYGTARDDWKIDRIKCDYVFLGLGRKNRTPKDRDFNTGEFEERFNQMLTIEYCFEDGLTAVDAYVMEQAVHAVNEEHPEFELKLDSFLLRGTHRAVFTIFHKDYADEAYKLIKFYFEIGIKDVKGQRDQVMEILSMLTS